MRNLINPDSFPGTDGEKITAALKLAATEKRTVIIDRTYSLSGS